MRSLSWRRLQCKSGRLGMSLKTRESSISWKWQPERHYLPWASHAAMIWTNASLYIVSMETELDLRLVYYRELHLRRRPGDLLQDQLFCQECHWDLLSHSVQRWHFNRLDCEAFSESIPNIALENYAGAEDISLWPMGVVTVTYGSNYTQVSHHVCGGNQHIDEHMRKTLAVTAQ